MKRLLISALILPVVILIYSWTSARPSNKDVEIRAGLWPITLERVDNRPGVSFSLIFRDQSEAIETVMDTLDFADMGQLKYLDEGLAALKNNGDCARYKDYSITRADKKFDDIYYILRADNGECVFRQMHADLLRFYIKDWIW